MEWINSPQSVRVVCSPSWLPVKQRRHPPRSEPNLRREHQSSSTSRISFEATKDAQFFLKKDSQVWAFMLSLCTDICGTYGRMYERVSVCVFFPPPIPSCVTGCLRSVIYAVRQKCGIGPEKKKGIEGWKWDSHLVSREVTTPSGRPCERLCRCALLLLLLIRQVGEPHLRAAFPRNRLILCGPQFADNTATHHHRPNQVESESLAC